MLNNTLNYRAITVLEAGESAKYKINYLTDGDGPLRSFMVMPNGSFKNEEKNPIFNQLIVKASEFKKL